MRRFAVVLAVIVGLSGLGGSAEADRLPKPMSLVKRERHHPMAAMHEPRGPKAERTGVKKIPADDKRDKRLTHGVRKD